MTRCLAAALVVCALGAGATAEAASLRQLGAEALPGGAAAAVSPDGRHVYVAANVEEDGQLLTYARDATSGALTRTGCLAETARDGCAASAALYGVNDVAVSRDGLTVYALGVLPGSVGVFRRDPQSGALTELQCFAESVRTQACPRARLDNVWKLALTPDGTSLIVAGTQITRFTVGADGLLSEPVQEAFGVRNPAAIAVGPSPSRVFVAGGLADRGKLTILRRDPATGALAAVACAGDGTVDGRRPCRRGRAVEGPMDLAVSPDGRGVYLAANAFTARGMNPFGTRGILHSSALGVFSPAGAGQKACLLYTGRPANRERCDRAPRARGRGFLGASAIALSPDGKVAVAGFERSRTVLVLRRNPRTQRLAPVAGKAGCVRDGRIAPARRPRGCQVGSRIGVPTDIAISPDSRHAYVTSRAGLTAYALQT